MLAVSIAVEIGKTHSLMVKHIFAGSIPAVSIIKLTAMMNKGNDLA